MFKMFKMVSSIYASSPTPRLEMDPQTITESFSNFTNAFRHNLDGPLVLYSITIVSAKKMMFSQYFGYNVYSKIKAISYIYQ